MPKADTKGISIVMENTTIHTCFDLKWTAEAVYNIMDNAVKYTETGGSITIKVIAYDLFCRIDITDSGIGIAEDELSKIFMRFSRYPTVSSQEGVGIGLFLAREIITAQGGYIKVQSRCGSGSTFSLFLPICQIVLSILSDFRKAVEGLIWIVCIAGRHNTDLTVR